jgi:hypothetical protein
VKTLLIFVWFAVESVGGGWSESVLSGFADGAHIPVGLPLISPMRGLE